MEFSPITLSDDALAPSRLLPPISYMATQENYQSYDTLEFKTFDIENTLRLCPLSSYIAVQDSPSIYVVTSRSISRNAAGNYELTVTATGFEGFARFRIVDTQHERKTYSKYEGQPQNFIAWLLETQVQYSPSQNYLLNYKPGIYGGMPTYAGDDLKNMIEDGENVWDVVQGVLSYRKLGIKTDRKSNVSNVLIHNGLDRRVGRVESGVKSVLFDSRMGDLVDERYFETIEDTFTESFVQRIQPEDSETGWPQSVSRWYTSIGGTGIGARVTSYKADDPEDYKTEILKRGREELEKKRQRLLYEGSAVLPEGIIWGSNLGIGDLVSVRGTHMQLDSMRVVSFTRTFDESGYNEYPTLEHYEDDA